MPETAPPPRSLLPAELHFPPADFIAACQFGQRVYYQQGDVIFRHGETDARMFFVESGEIELLFGSGKSAKRVTAGQIFGELFLVTGDNVRTATARALNRAALVVADSQALDALMSRQPALALALMRYSCSYLLRSEQALIGELKRKNQELSQTLDYLRRTREELTYQELAAVTDELTGLYNRRCLKLQLPKALERTRALQGSLVVLSMDLDGFKQVNDQLGHLHGDEVLQRVAQLLNAQARKSDLICRTGGDEFVLILADMALEPAVAMAERVRAAVATEFTAEAARGLPLSVSIGVLHSRGQEGDEELLAGVDALLYEAKRLGKNQVVWPGM